MFLNVFGLPRSAPVSGGLVLSLMTLPTIIISSRAAIRAVPPSFAEAAIGLGASRVQAIFHHVLPVAAPGTLTGAIIGMAQALGETAPLLMMGMVAFVAEVPGGFTDPSTVLPAQVYLWADSPERGFAEKTAAAIIVLLGFLLVMNGLAVLPPPKVREAMVTASVPFNPQSKLVTREVSVFYGEKQAVFDVDLDILPREVTAFIGPSGCGKSTLLRCFNRMNDLIENCQTMGSMLLDGNDIAGPNVDVVQLRSRIGMVFQKPNPFPKSVYDNVAYGSAAPRSRAVPQRPRRARSRPACGGPESGTRSRTASTSRERACRGGQQQRLCIARAIAVRPDVLLMDEPCSALDPIATADH